MLFHKISYMRKFFLIKNQHTFQGEKLLQKNNVYFEGWYYKNTTEKDSIVFIPGINITSQNKEAFIQVLTSNKSYYLNYSIEDFEYRIEPFYIKIGNNIFTKDNIHIDIKKKNLRIFGNINYTFIQNIKKSKYSPNIMGPFSYLPFMECNHAIIGMKIKANGILKINNNQLIFKGTPSYIEKDWGYSFPQKYIWCQANNFNKYLSSFMISIAHIPFKIFYFCGLVCSLIVDNVEYRFTTYNNSKIKKFTIQNDCVEILLKKGKLLLHIAIKNYTGQRLIAPIKGKMSKEIIESINAVTTVTLKKKDKTIYSDTSTNCGLEIVK